MILKIKGLTKSIPNNYKVFGLTYPILVLLLSLRRRGNSFWNPQPNRRFILYSSIFVDYRQKKPQEKL
jgi:hypothetical protein